MQRALQFCRKLRLSGDGFRFAALPGQILSDSNPKVAVRWLLSRHGVVRDRNAWHLHDTGLDGIDEREVGNNPRKEGSFRVTGSAKEEWRRRKIVDGLNADLRFNGLDSGNPDPGLFLPLLRFLSIVTGQFFSRAVGLPPVAVVGFIVQDHEILLVSEFAAHATHHLIGRLGKAAGAASGEDRFRDLTGGDRLAKLKRMEVGDQNPGLAELLARMRWSDVTNAKVVLRIVRQENAQPIADGNAWRNDQKGVGETSILGICELVQRMPGDEHGHNDGLTGACRHLERDSWQSGVRSVIAITKVVLDPRVAVSLRDFHDVDGRLECFDLAKEKFSNTIRIVPIRKQSAGRRRYADVAALTPLPHAPADLVDEFVFLDTVFGPLGFKGKLAGALLLRFSNGYEIRTSAPLINDVVGNSFIAEPEVARRFDVRRIQNWVFDDNLSHVTDGNRNPYTVHRQSCSRVWSGPETCVSPDRLEFAKLRLLLDSEFSLRNTEKIRKKNLFAAALGVVVLEPLCLFDGYGHRLVDGDAFGRLGIGAGVRGDDLERGLCGLGGV